MKVDEKKVFIQIVLLKIMDLEGSVFKVLPTQVCQNSKRKKVGILPVLAQKCCIQLAQFAADSLL